MNNKEMLKVVQNVFDNVIDPTAIPTLRKGFSTGTPWGKANLDGKKSLMSPEIFKQCIIEVYNAKPYHH